MKLKLRKIGNSWGVIFPKESLKPFGDNLSEAYIEVDIGSHAEKIIPENSETSMEFAAFCPDPKCDGDCNYMSHISKPQAVVMEMVKEGAAVVQKPRMSIEALRRVIDENGSAPEPEILPEDDIQYVNEE